MPWTLVPGPWEFAFRLEWQGADGGGAPDEEDDRLARRINQAADGWHVIPGPPAVMAAVRRLAEEALLPRTITPAAANEALSRLAKQQEPGWEGAFEIRSTASGDILVTASAAPGARPAPQEQRAFLRRVQELEKSLRAIFQAGPGGKIPVSLYGHIHRWLARLPWLGTYAARLLATVAGPTGDAAADYHGLVARLAEAAKIAIGARVIDIPLASLYLEGIEADAVLARGRPLKRRFMGWMALGLALGFALLFLLVWAFPPWAAGWAPSLALAEPTRTLLALALFSGAVGAWVSFAVSVAPNTLAVLTDIAEASLGTVTRAFVIMVLIFIALVMLRAGLVSISIDGYASTALFASKAAAIVTGFALGFGQASLVKALSARLSDIIAAFGAGK